VHDSSSKMLARFILKYAIFIELDFAKQAVVNESLLFG
jgi:hypothetical protein